jgi:sulfonate transport system permease protein
VRRSWIKSALAQLWLPVVLVVILWIWTAGSSNFYFPPLKTMLGALWTGLTEGELRSDLIYSVKNILAGLAIAVVVGVLVGLVIGERERLRRATQPLLDFARATPTIAFVPVIILSFGIGAAPKIFLIFLGSVWPILLNTVSGVAAINPAVHETARSYCIPWRLRLFKVTLPGAMPQIFAGIRVALQVAIVLMVVSEIYGSPIGLGNFILQSGSSFRVADTWAGTILIGVLGYALNVVFLLFERSLLAWHFQQAPRTRRRSRTSATAGLSPAE